MGAGLFEAHVLQVAVHHGDGIDVAAAANIGNGEVFGGANTHVDVVGVRLTGTVGVGGRVVLTDTVVFNDGDVVVGAWVRHLTCGVIEALAAEQENIVVGGGWSCLTSQRWIRFAPIAYFDAAVGVLLSRTQGGDEAVGGGGDGALVGDNTLGREVAQKVENVNVVVPVLVGVAHGHVPHPEVSKSFANGPVPVAAATVFKDGDVARLTGWCTGIVGLERVVLLINDDIDSVVAGEFTHFHLLNVGELVPVRITALVAGDPDVLSLVEVAKAVVVENGHRVCAVRCHGHVVVAVTVEITDGDVHGVAVGGVAAGNRCAGGGGEGRRGAEHH